MQSNDLDAYFHMASEGNSEAYYSLYKEFIKRAKYVVREAIKSVSNQPKFVDDFGELIDGLFFKVINDYDNTRGSFTHFVDYIFEHRLTNIVQKEVIANNQLYANVEYDDEQEVKTTELFKDPNQLSMVSDIAINGFIYEIASPNKHKSNARRLRDKILMLQYAGYSNAKICEILKISMFALNREKEKIMNDQDIMDLKINLK